ncbi:uncharacterized protein [Pagrus major]|uniref:uncharacterized protein n=1 Tax=Pagrus major TaxID=143350 RepID=UPI003CC876D5
MGTILKGRVPQQCLERVSIRERDWKKKVSWSNSRPNVASNKIGRRQSQRKSPQPQCMLPSQENNNEKRLHQRRQHKPNTTSTKSSTPQHSAQGATESMSHPLSHALSRMELKVQLAAHHREQKHKGFRRSRHSPAFPCHRLTDSNPDLLDRLSPNPVVGNLSDHGECDSDTDLSVSERLPMSPSCLALPQLELRPEVIEAEDCSACNQRPRGCCHGGFDFPDSLPPPFNSWSLSQLAVFYNMEGRGAPRPRPVGPLERYLERLLQLEWRQIQTSQEENGKSVVSDVVSSCHRSPAAAASSRLSSPKCILQCQRAFPLTFFSSLASHSALLSGCACTLCRIHYSTISPLCSRSTHSRTRQSRLSPTLERKGPTSLSTRSYSESRVHSSDRSYTSQTQGFTSPVRSNSHLRRMQASGNIRNPVQGANTKSHSTARDSSVGAGRESLEAWRDMLDYRTGGFRMRSGSEQRRGGVERHEVASEKRRSGSECRRGGAEWRRTAELKEWEIKPDAVTAIMDNLPGSKNSPTNRVKQVELVT